MICDRCNREVHPWPLERGNSCSPPDWVHCIRNDEAALRQITDEWLREHVVVIHVKGF